MIDVPALADYMQRFFGYGSWQAKYWFVGMEEGGGSGLDEVEARLRSWDARGRPDLDDLYEFHRAARLMKWFTSDAPLQRTWNQLMRAVLVAEGRNAEKPARAAYQRMRLGRRDGETALLELLPLPSKNVGSWIYGSIAALPQLRSRDTYMSSTRPIRLAALRRKIDEHSPHAVVFYGNRREWRSTFGLESGQFFDRGRTRNTVLLATEHPVAYGNTNERFIAIGEYLRSLTE